MVPAGQFASELHGETDGAYKPRPHTHTQLIYIPTTPTDPITTHQSAALATPTGSLTARQSGLAVAIHA